MKSGIVVISLYDGLSATRDFLLKLRVPIVRYVPVEIDPVARRMADWRYEVGFSTVPQPPNDRILGNDVNALTKAQLRRHWGKGEGVLVVGGIPCTSLSTANSTNTGADRLAVGTATGDGVRAFAAVLDALPAAKWLSECTPSNMEDSIFDRYLGAATRLNAAYWTKQCRRRDIRACENIDSPEARGIAPSPEVLGDVVDFRYEPKRHYAAVVWPGRCENPLLYPRRAGVLPTPSCVRAMLGIAAGTRNQRHMTSRGGDAVDLAGQSPSVLSGGKNHKGKSSVPVCQLPGMHNISDVKAQSSAIVAKTDIRSAGGLIESPLMPEGRVARAYSLDGQSESLPSSSGLGKPSLVAVNPNLEFGGKQSALVPSQGGQSYAVSSGNGRYRGRGNYSAVEVRNEKQLRACVRALAPELKKDMVAKLKKARLWQGWTLARTLNLQEATRLFGYREFTVCGGPLSDSATFRLLGQSFPPGMMAYAARYALGMEQAAAVPLFSRR